LRQEQINGKTSINFHIDIKAHTAKAFTIDRDEELNRIIAFVESHTSRLAMFLLPLLHHTRLFGLGETLQRYTDITNLRLDDRFYIKKKQSKAVKSDRKRWVEKKSAPLEFELETE